MDRDACELRQNPDGLQGGLPPAGIDVIVREGGRAGHMHPMPFACHREARFILMDHFALDQGLFDLLLDSCQLSGTPLDQGTDRAFTHLDAQQVAHHFTGTGQGQQLLFDQVHRRCCHMRSILDGSLHSGGKGGDGDLLAVGTLFLLGPIFLHQHTRRGQIHHLTPLSPTGRHHVQILLAGLTLSYLQLNDLIWSRGELQAGPRVSWLPARLLLALGAQAFRVTHKPIRGGRQVAIVAIFGGPVSQGFQLLAQAAHLLCVLLDHGVLLGEHRLLLLDQFVSLCQVFSQHLILCSQSEQFFFDRHALTLLALTPFGKSPADLAGLFGLPGMHVFHLPGTVLHAWRLPYKKGISGKPNSPADLGCYKETLYETAAGKASLP